MGENEGGGEVRIKLVVDDQSSATVAKVRDGMKEISEHTEKTKKSFDLLGLAIGKTNAHGIREFREKIKGVKGHTEQVGAGLETAGMAVEGLAAGAAIAAAAIGAAAAAAGVLGHAAVEAAVEADNQERAMSGILGMLDREEHSRAQIQEYVGRTREELEESAIAMGVSTEKVVGAFQAIVERGNLGSEKAKELAEQMALVGRITHGGMEGLAQGFSMMEMGIVRARNPLVQLIAATGTLHGNAKAVAQQMQKMTPEAQMELAEKAISKQAELMKKGGGVPMSLPMLQESFKGFREMVLDAMGRPMLEHILPPLRALQAFLIEHKETIIDFANKMGEKFGGFIDVVVSFSKEVYSAVSQNWDAFATAFGDVFADGKSTFEFIYDNGPILAKTLGDVIKDIADAFRWIHKTLEKWEHFKGDVGRATGGIIGGAAVNREQDAIEKKARAAAHSPEEKDQKEINELRQRYVDNANAMGQNAREAGEMFDRIYSFHAETMKTAAEVDAAAANGNVKPVVDAYNLARNHHDTAMVEYTAGIIAGSKDLQTALLFSGEQLVEGGFGALSKLVKEHNPTFARELLAKGPLVKDIPGGPSVNFNNNTFNIKQDFKDQDPDRIAVVFRKDLVKHATANAQSRLAGAGGF